MIYSRVKIRGMGFCNLAYETDSDPAIFVLFTEHVTVPKHRKTAEEPFYLFKAGKHASRS